MVPLTNSVGGSAFYITWLTSTDSLSGDLRSKLMTYHGERNGFLSSQQLYRDIDCESAIFFVDPVKIDASLLLEDSVSLLILCGNRQFALL